MNTNENREPLSQEHNLKWIRRTLQATDMFTVYRWDPDDHRQSCFILSGLIPSNLAYTMITHGDHISNVVENVWAEPAAYTPHGENSIRYFAWGVEEHQHGSIPLVIKRNFESQYNEYLEIVEEFRLFHNLYHDRDTDEYYKNSELIAVITPNEVQIRLKELRQYLAIKKMYLSMLFEFNEYSEQTLEELELSEIRRDDFNREGNTYGYTYWVSDRINMPGGHAASNSRLRGRGFIKPLPLSECGLGDYRLEHIS